MPTKIVSMREVRQEFNNIRLRSTEFRPDAEARMTLESEMKGLESEGLLKIFLALGQKGPVNDVLRLANARVRMAADGCGIWSPSNKGLDFYYSQPSFNCVRSLTRDYLLAAMVDSSVRTQQLAVNIIREDDHILQQAVNNCPDRRPEITGARLRPLF